MKKFDFINKKDYGDGEGILWAVFPAKYSDDRLKKFLATHYDWAFAKSVDRKPIDCFQDCERNFGAGQYYQRGICFNRQGSRVLVSQSFGVCV